MNSNLQLILSLADRCLELWNDSRKDKYQKSMMKLKKAYAKEMDKEKSDHNVLDHLEREMFFISDLLNTELRLAAKTQKTNRMQQ